MKSVSFISFDYTLNNVLADLTPPLFQAGAFLTLLLFFRKFTVVNEKTYIMKKFLSLMAVLMTLVISSCVTVKPSPFTSNVYYLDYYKLGHNGKILLSESNSFSGEYQSIGSIIVSQTSGHVKIETEKSTKKVKVSDVDDIYGIEPEYKTETKYKTGDYKQATFSTALEEAVNAAEDMGGDAIINLQFKQPDSQSVVVSGMVIKRKY